MTVGERELLINKLRSGDLQSLLIIQRELNKEIYRLLQKEEDR